MFKGVRLAALQHSFCVSGALGRSCAAAGVLSMLLGASTAFAQRVPSSDPAQYGPYNGVFLAGGLGLRTPIKNTADTILLPTSPWTMAAWVRADESGKGLELLAGVGDISAEYPRFLALDNGHVALWMGKDNELTSASVLEPGAWHLLAATFDGAQVQLYLDGMPVAKGALTLGTASPVLQMAPPILRIDASAAYHPPVREEKGKHPVPVADVGNVSAGDTHFGGKIAAFVVLRHALSPAEIQAAVKSKPEFNTILFDQGSSPWPIQSRGWGGYTAPQNPDEMPTSRAPYSKPEVKKRAPVGPSLMPSGTGEWTFADGWTMREAPKVQGDAAEIASAKYKGGDWMRATVPGTALSTMIDDGIYPDPDYGLNNLAIPESLNRQDYWYRNVFALPTDWKSVAGQHVELTFEGINYKAYIWLNGKQLGTMKGAFRRGKFDVTSLLKPGAKNVLAVRISPPPHPGIPQEQSVLGGPGENGGMMELDGPTFLATEGWDWVPAIRDRDSGIWQPVKLTVSGALRLGDAQVVTTFAHHDLSKASVAINVPVTNLSANPAEAKIDAAFEGVEVHKTITVPPGKSEVKLLPSEFPQLAVTNPRLWWPNGYGKPELYHLKLKVSAGDGIPDTRAVQFGMREIGYELSLLDASGHLRRVQFTPGNQQDAKTPIVDVSHDGMRAIPGADAIALNVSEEERQSYQFNSVVSSLPADAEKSPAIEPSEDLKTAPYLVIVVNGVRIAARGGNWGMDDSRKRVSRAHLEPFFRLNRDANLNIIRNWVGQNTEETFYDLADEYGMLVWNDFWESTQNYNLEAEDPQLFLANVKDTIEHFRNHPSVAVWCGRNEGVPQPIINHGIEKLVRTLDGTRFYSPSSNQVNLQESGPYSYQNPSLYYTALNRGFSVETGTPSMSTLESFESTTPKADQWPMDDVWAYHDWHASGNGDTKPFMDEIEAEFGAATSLPDFERKAQMLNYVDHRAIFEGMNANLWAPNSGRLLWMTQPAWPSTMWQILSSDYDTQASFYGTKKACEPLHVQLNLASGQVDVVNTTAAAAPGGLSVQARVYSLTNSLLFEKNEPVQVGADAVTHSLELQLGSYMKQGMVLVDLRLMDASHLVVSKNLYWLGSHSSDYRALTKLAPAAMQLTASGAQHGGETTYTVQLTNNGKAASLENKLTLLNKNGQRILPAYYSDNYVSLLPGEAQTITVTVPSTLVAGDSSFALRGWNAVPQSVKVTH